MLKRKKTSTKEGNQRRPASAEARRSLFVREYLIDRNGTQAAIRAGFAAKSAHVTASRLLKDPKVAAEIEATTAKTLDRLEISRERVLREVAKMAFADLRNILSWGPDAKEVVDPATGLVIGKTSGVSLRASTEIDDIDAAAISEISETATGGLKVKMHSKEAALKMLGQELGLFRDRQPGDAPDNPLHLLIEAVQREAAPLPVQEPNAHRLARHDVVDVRPVASSASPAARSPQTVSPLLRPQGA